jgi:hypothetical protein
MEHFSFSPGRAASKALLRTSPEALSPLKKKHMAPASL